MCTEVCLLGSAQNHTSYVPTFQTSSVLGNRHLITPYKGSNSALQAWQLHLVTATHVTLCVHQLVLSVPRAVVISHVVPVVIIFVEGGAQLGSL